MDINGISGGIAQTFDQQTFGAAVVSKTLDYMNKSSSPELIPGDKESFDAAVVTKTLDFMNAKDNLMTDSYSFQKDVLQGHLTGALLNQMV